ncbi:MAG: helicase associated domain-containing protein [Paraclostridium sp.]
MEIKSDNIVSDSTQKESLMKRWLDGYGYNKVQKVSLMKRWLDVYNKVLLFITKNNRYPLYKHGDKEGYADERKLSVWISRQRSYYKDCKIHRDRIKLLEQLPNWKWRSYFGKIQL